MFAPFIVGLVLFGWTDPETHLQIERNPFEDSFDTASNQRAWAKVGAAAVVPGGSGEGRVSRNCLGDE